MGFLRLHIVRPEALALLFSGAVACAPAAPATSAAAAAPTASVPVPEATPSAPSPTEAEMSTASHAGNGRGEQHPKDHTNRGAPPSDDVHLGYMLCVLYPLRHSGPVPANYDLALSSFNAADVAFNAGDNLEAAANFLEAAELMSRMPSAGQEDVINLNRRVAYANAGLAWLNGEHVALAASAFRAAATADPELTADLLRTARAFPDPPACHLE